MAKKAHHVTPKDGEWEVRKQGAKRASGTYDTKAEAVERGTELAKKQEGQLKIHGKDGKIQQERTYGKDPYPPPG